MESPIDGVLLAQELRERNLERPVYAFDSLDSTNLFAVSLARAGATDGTVVVADTQTAGRGRWGRTWISPAGKGLAFSVVLRPRTHPPRRAALLTLLGATSVVLAVERHVGLRPRLRWPNDVDLDGRKICGVLTEAKRRTGSIEFAVMGVGINVNQTADDFPEDLRPKAGSVRIALGRPVDRVPLLVAVIEQLALDLRRAETEGFEFVLDRWIQRNAVLGRTVRLKTGEVDLTGRVRGFHADGRLILVDSDGNERRFSDGEVIEVRHALDD